MARLFAEAALLAAQAHSGAMRKGGDIPYINHPLSVAAALAEVREDEAVLCAAVLHDTVEDTALTFDEIEARFGLRVAGLVGELTDPENWTSLPTARPKAFQIEEFRAASRDAQAIKIADQWSNVSDLSTTEIRKNAYWLSDYLRTSRELVEVCRGAAPILAARFDEAAERLERKIEGMQV